MQSIEDLYNMVEAMETVERTSSTRETDTHKLTLSDLPNEVLIKILGYVVGSKTALKFFVRAKYTGSRGARNNHHKQTTAKLAASKHILAIAKTAYFRCQKFSLTVSSHYHGPAHRVVQNRHMKVVWKGSFADNKDYYNNVESLALKIDIVFIADGRIIMSGLRPFLRACKRLTKVELEVKCRGSSPEMGHVVVADVHDVLKEMSAERDRRVSFLVRGL
ncbi:hypothetical protein B0A55_02288 [Friedmanniomyces simplex]|uniref:Uncharacterized protein n=1 Tax=Friedmanniomyces simplex TaxID=329884 RepID=A0A4U0Y349_9PEZI|nr:hypothetical protein B0A55_02288 [Friedmanniomyces simplex]